jgi:TetR/AcrR family transcriptional regulator
VSQRPRVAAARADDEVALLAVPRPKDDTRQALVAAAIQAFSRSGYDGVSVRDIERQAGVNRGLVAYHFGSKEELWKLAIDALMGDFRMVMERYSDLFPMLSPEERKRVLLKVYVMFVAKRPEFFRIMVLEGNDRSDRTRWFNERYLHRLVNFFDQHTGLAADRSPEDQVIDHFVFTGAASMVFAAAEQSRQLFGVDPNSEAFIERFADFIAEYAYRDDLRDSATMGR